MGELIGREREVATALRLVQQTALLTLVGPGGVGKTRLALRVAAEAGGRFADGVVFVPLGPISDPGLVATAIATALDIQEGGVRSLTTTLIATLQSQELLLVLDNFEQVMEAAPLVADLLAGCPRLTMLVTSRTPLHLSVEQEFSVPPLAIPTLAEAATRQIATLQQVPAVALFVARAQRTDPDFMLTDENGEAIAAICRRLDGLPLALELAAARIKVLAPMTLRARLEQSLDVLTGGARDLPARQQTLRNTIAWSYGLLSATEQALFARLSVFVGGCSLAAVEAICGRDGESDTLEGLAALVDQSLLRRDDEHPERTEDSRFMMLETVREFARDQLAARGEADELSRRHALYFTTLAEAAAHAPSAEELEWIERLERDAENLRAAMGWCLARAEAGDGEATELGLRLVDGLGLNWVLRGRAREMQHALLRLFSRPEAAAFPRARARSLLYAGHSAGFAGSFAQAFALIEEGLTLARALGESGMVASALVILGMGREDPVQRQADLEEAVALERSTGCAGLPRGPLSGRGRCAPRPRPRQGGPHHGSGARGSLLDPQCPGRAGTDRPSRGGHGEGPPALRGVAGAAADQARQGLYRAYPALSGRDRRGTGRGRTGREPIMPKRSLLCAMVGMSTHYRHLAGRGGAGAEGGTSRAGTPPGGRRQRCAGDHRSTDLDGHCAAPEALGAHELGGHPVKPPARCWVPRKRQPPGPRDRPCRWTTRSPML